MIKYLSQSVKDIDNKELPVYKPGSWVYVEDPSNEELSNLVEKFDLEIGHLQDALDPNEVPRHEEEGNTTYVFTRTPIQQGNTFITSPVLLIIHPKSIITVTKTQNPIFKTFLENRKNLITANRARLFIKFFNEIVLHYSNAITKINKQATAATINIDNIQNKDIVQLVIYEQILNEFLNAVVQTNAILRGLTANKSLFRDIVEKDLIEDVFLATGQLIALSKSSLQQVKNVRETYSTIMTNNLNRVIKLFTALTIIFTIPMIISSFYGMNVRLPIGDNPYAFIIILIFALGVSASVLYFFQRRRWL